MEFLELSIPGVWLITPRIFSDDRGNFMESFNHLLFEEKTGVAKEFVQDNHSISSKGVFRGLHFQKPPFAQGKLVRVTQGSVIDYFVDLRKDSDFYGKIGSQKLDTLKRQMLYVPEGFAHGFLSLEEDTHFLYKCTNYYSPEHEGTINYKSISQISLPLEKTILNQKDLEGDDFKSFSSPF